VERKLLFLTGMAALPSNGAKVLAPEKANAKQPTAARFELNVNVTWSDDNND
jgi:hypothetical protein